jgi:hypothetical protein
VIWAGAVEKEVAVDEEDPLIGSSTPTVEASAQPPRQEYTPLVRFVLLAGLRPVAAERISRTKRLLQGFAGGPMSKRLPLTVALGALMTALLGAPAPAGSAAPRVHTLEYVGGGVVAGETRDVAVRVGDGMGAVVFRGGPERFVSLEIDDAHGQPVTGIVVQPSDDDGRQFCGATAKPLRIRPYENVTVFLMNGTCGDAGASVATTGTVTATFTQK